MNLFGPPEPLSKGGTPICVVSYVSGAASGTFDSSTGEECDGASDASCPGACDQLCLCH